MELGHMTNTIGFQSTNNLHVRTSIAIQSC